MTTPIGTQGYVPQLAVGAGNPEAAKYGKLWAMPEYRETAPGELMATTFLKQVHPNPKSKVIDFGCGTGRGALALAAFGDLDVTMIDFVRNCLDPEIQQACETQSHMLRFLKADLEWPIPVTTEYGYCTDVMEHIPPEKVDQVLDNILQAARHVFFSISTVDDIFGAKIGETLHLTVQPYSWWLMQFARRECVIHWSQELSSAALFYVSAWQRVERVVDGGLLNETNEAIRENVRINCAAGWQQVRPHERNDQEVMILGGGPSLPQFLEEIRRQKAAGLACVTLNGVYGWAFEQGLFPVTQVMVDSRAFNARFTKPIDTRNLYLIASQCHPSVLEGLPKDRTYLWHTMFDLIHDLVEPHYPAMWPVYSCTTVLNTSMLLLRMLGFGRFHLYGCDSCLGPEQQHHAYAQPENDATVAIPVSVTGGRIFWCHPWMAAQAQQFIELIKFLGHEIEVAVYGDGLLKAILDAGAEASVLAHEGE